MLPSTSISTTPPSSVAFTSFMLGRLRFAHARAQLICNQVATVSAALRGGHIGPETALLHLHECGLVDFVTGVSSHD